MLVAKEKVEYYGLPEEKPKILKKKEQSFRFNKKLKVTLCLFVFAAFLFGLFFTSKYAQLSHAGQQLLKKQEALAAIQLENEQLEKEVLRLQSLDRIENIAVTKLGMQVPDDEGIYFLAVESNNGIKEEAKEKNSEIIKVAKATENTEITKDTKDSFLSALSNFWINWLGKIEEAEAETLIVN